MRYFLIAGEASGDMHGATLMAEIKKNDPEAEFFFFGGNLMQEQGGTLIKHYREMAFMGIIPVLLNLNKIRKNLNLCKNQIRHFNPSIVILIDYPGFNLRIAQFAKANGFKTAYYISPKIWATRTKRVFSVKKNIDAMYTIFPFETAFYASYGYKANYVGNPSYDHIALIKEQKTDNEKFRQEHKLCSKPIVALLPGSRKHEICSLLPPMCEVAPFFPEYQFIIAGAPNIEPALYHKYNSAQLPIIEGSTYHLLRNSQAAIVASGTATLETALLEIPQLVIYKMGFGKVLELFRKQILKTDFFSLVNLVAEKEVVKEYFQSEVTLGNLKNEMEKILNNREYRANMIENYHKIAKELHSTGAAKNAARCIVDSLTDN